MKVTRTVTIDGSNRAEFDQIKAHLEALQAQFPGWTLIPEPLVNRMTATRSDETDTL